MTADRRRFWLFWLAAWVLGAGVWRLSHLRSGLLNVAEAMSF
jgi:hypothetical protein